MSSHHIVRDEQEPALLALNARWLGNETLASLLEWSPTIVVPANEVETLTSLGFKPDVVVATIDERNASADSWDMLAPLTVLERSNTEDVAMAALHYLLAKKHKAVNIFASPFNLPLAEFDLFFANMDIVFYNQTSRWLWVRNGQYSKWLPAATNLNVKSVGGPQEFTWIGFTTKPTQQDLHSASLVVENDDVVSIGSPRPFLLEEQL